MKLQEFISETLKEIIAGVKESQEYAASEGWRVMKAGPRAHIWGTIYCHESSRAGCRFHIYSAPRNPQNHARAVRRAVDACCH